MKISKLIGIILLVILLAGIFYISAVPYGFIVALKTWVGAIILVFLIFLSIFLIVKD